MCESDSNPDSELFGLDSDSGSELKSKNPDSDSRKKGGFGFESGFEISYPITSLFLTVLHMYEILKIRCTMIKLIMWKGCASEV